MVNVHKLKGKMVEKQISAGELAHKLEIDRSTFYRKLSQNGESFTIREANLICRILDLSCEEATAIFFNHYVA